MAFWASSQPFVGFWALGLLSTFSGSQNLFWAFSRASQKPTKGTKLRGTRKGWKRSRSLEKAGKRRRSPTKGWEESQKPAKSLEEARGSRKGPEEVLRPRKGRQKAQRGQARGPEAHKRLRRGVPLPNLSGPRGLFLALFQASLSGRLF